MAASTAQGQSNMIRSNLPIPFLYRLRLQASSAARRMGAMSSYHGTAGTAGKPLNARQAAARRGGSATDAEQLWQEFVAQYEEFTGVLCAAAQYGCDDKKEAQYAQMRRWFVSHYYRIAARVRPYLDMEFAEERGRGELLPTITDYAGQKRTLDVLEALFMPLTLRVVLSHDTGDLIPHIARISEAVYRCHEEHQGA